MTDPVQLNVPRELVDACVEACRHAGGREVEPQYAVSVVLSFAAAMLKAGVVEETMLAAMREPTH